MRGTPVKPAHPKRQKGSVADLIVPGGMLLLAAAIGAGFHFHLGLAAGPAIALAVAIGSMLMGMRALSGQTIKLANLGGEIHRLELEIERLKTRQPGGPGIEVRSQFSNRLPEPSLPGSAELTKERETNQGAPMTPPALTPAKTDAQNTAVAEANAILRGSAELKTPASGEPMKSAWSFRPANPRLDASQPVGLKAPKFKPGPSPSDIPPPIDAYGPPPSVPGANSSSVPSGSETREPANVIPASSLREADVEMIQGLIKKLADDVNAADVLRKSGKPPMAEAAPEPAPSLAKATREAIDQSVGALKRIAGAMAVSPPPPDVSRAMSPPPSLEARSLPPAPPLRGTLGPDRVPPPQANYDSTPLMPAAQAPIAPPRSEFADAIASGRVDVLLEPIIGLGDLRPRHYEVSLRLTDRNGEAVEASPRNPQFANAGLLPLLDRTRLERTIGVAGRLDKRGKVGSVISEYSRDSLTDREFLLGAKACRDQNPALTGQLVLSFAQEGVRHLSDTQWAALAALKSIGFRFGVQDITDLDMDFARLAEAGFAFAKLDADVFLEGLRAPHGFIPASDICRYFASLGVALVVGRIDDESERARLFGFGVVFGQGHLFGGARPMKVDALAETEHRAA